ncbi:MAG TPA: MgtC/SapB family protein [Burkholderiales bacterium]|nr:MgtC/SapB family protein [Burkholderiales bacterium]
MGSTLNFGELFDNAGLDLLPAFATSLAIGLLIGLERERHPNAKAGLRTIALTSLFGTLTALLGAATATPWLPAAGLLAVGAMIVAVYFGEPDGTAQGDPGTTTVIAVLLAYGLGMLVYLEHGNLAIALAIIITALLYFKPELRGILQHFSRHDLLAVLQFAALTFVVLPVLPDRGYGPYGALNPHRIWLMVVLISGLSLTGYIALKLAGGRRSAIMLGISGGLVSTTAITLLFSRLGRDRSAVPLAARVIIIANLALLVRLAVLTAVAGRDLLPHLLPVLGLALFAGVAAVALRPRLTLHHDLPPPRTANPMELRTALGFGLLFGVVLFVSAWLTDVAGNRGLYIGALIAGLPDVDAITLSVLRLHEVGSVPPATAVTAIVLALLANQTTKLLLVAALGGARLFRSCALPLAATGITAVAASALLA